MSRPGRLARALERAGEEHGAEREPEIAPPDPRTLENIERALDAFPLRPHDRRRVRSLLIAGDGRAARGAIAVSGQVALVVPWPAREVPGFEVIPLSGLVPK